MKTRNFGKKSKINKFCEVQLSTKQKTNRIVGGGNSQVFGGWIPVTQGNDNP